MKLQRVKTTQVNAVEVEIDSRTGYAISINRVFCSRDNIEKESEHED